MSDEKNEPEEMIKPEKAEAGKWYFTTICPSCNNRFPVMADDSEGAIKFSWPTPEGSTRLRVMCVFCKVWAEHDQNQIVSWFAVDPNKLV
jgi:hypothetical protein